MDLRVTQYGETVLRQVGEPVETFDFYLRQLADDMIDAMHRHEGAGLAAQQVGKALQMFVMDIGRDLEQVPFDYHFDSRVLPLNLIMPMVVCNPRIEPLHADEKESEEGCLSFPGLSLKNIWRKEAIKMDFRDVDGHPHTLECDGFLARCCQHEYDHLQGVLFIDRASKDEVRRYQSYLKKLKRSSRDLNAGSSE